MKNKPIDDRQFVPRETVEALEIRIHILAHGSDNPLSRDLRLATTGIRLLFAYPPKAEIPQFLNPLIPKSSTPETFIHLNL